MEGGDGADTDEGQDDTTPVDLEVHLGAGDTKLVLGRVKLQSLSIDLGAGDQTIDLRGMPLTGLIGDRSVQGLEKQGSRWVNPRAEVSPVTIDLQLQHAIGDLRLLAE